MSRFSFEFRLAACVALLCAASAIAQQPAPITAGPIPPAIRTAKAIFVSNAGAGSGLFPSPFSGDQNRGYDQFYAEIRAAGVWELVADPSDADLVLELRLEAPNGASDPIKANQNKPWGIALAMPMFRLVVYDRKTHYVLWAMTQSVGAANLQKTHDRNFDEALTALLLEFEGLAGKLPSAAAGEKRQ